jgi:hypothetical protein
MMHGQQNIKNGWATIVVVGRLRVKMVSHLHSNNQVTISWGFTSKPYVQLHGVHEDTKWQKKNKRNYFRRLIKACFVTCDTDCTILTLNLKNVNAGCRRNVRSCAKYINLYTNTCGTVLYTELLIRTSRIGKRKEKKGGKKPYGAAIRPVILDEHILPFSSRPWCGSGSHGSHYFYKNRENCLL